MPTKADLESILAHAGLDFPERQFTVKIPTRKEDVIESPYEVLRSLAKNEGLKAITERIRYARKLANKTNQKINWHSFIDAHHRIEKQATQEPEWN
jgi:hypothetical protein